ncbi:Undecaprenyl-phosphate mannosyltransferase [Novipirellula galeiformis]|uniref:Undecaprenyl-phosphate mannosyltransferase n=1 Tax=Novipirellula galeiformis TaxID=2528004 RepID=A0A5C6CTA3_9BACT|nr:glycosyltransferase family 2 protein [Novipirellula galeiformis]TWU27105.1 Undecaprenyl-phosphate mannosyltransferase [Novipirellula galeiformis]
MPIKTEHPTDLGLKTIPVAIQAQSRNASPLQDSARAGDQRADFQAADASDCWDIDLVDSTDEVIHRTEATLDFLAQASIAAAHAEPLDHYDLTIIVPVFNERETLGKVLERIDEVMPRSTEVIVVDDGSTDGTSEWLAGLAPRANRTVIRRRRNHGKGSAVRLAIRHSRGGVVAIQDADLEYDPAFLLRAIWPILDGNADVVYGSRYLGGSTDPSLVHRLGNWMLTTLSNQMTGLRLTDMETCHKAFDGEMLRSISLKECRFGFEPEITAKIAAKQIRLLEVPTNYDYRGYDEGKKIGWKDAVAALACMWIYRKG